MLALATCMLGAFIIHSALKDIDVDDDDDMDGGMLIPAYNPIWQKDFTLYNGVESFLLCPTIKLIRMKWSATC